MKKYYKDYKPITKVSPEGQPKQEMEYTGKYYNCQLTEDQLKRKKMQYIIFVFCITVIETGIGFLNNPGSRMFYVVLPYVGLFLPTIYSIIGTGIFAKSGTSLEYAVYDKSRNRIYHSTVAQIVLGIMVIFSDICFILSEKNIHITVDEPVFIMGMLIQVLLCILFLFLQKRIVYEIQ
jgi:hypothetical protein